LLRSKTKQRCRVWGVALKLTANHEPQPRGQDGATTPCAPKLRHWTHALFAGRNAVFAVFHLFENNEIQDFGQFMRQF
jgi:hypothetical protein